MADFRLSELFGEGMIIQRNKPVVITGEAFRVCEIHAGLEEEQTSKVVEPGPFFIELPPRGEGKDLTLRVWTKTQKEEIGNVFCGEVWVAGGQSNMAFELREAEEYKNGMQIVSNEEIRFYSVGQNSLNTPEEYGEGYEWAYSQDSGWLACSEETAPYVSAAGYFFAEEIYKELHVPVGIICCAVGGSGIFAWMPEDVIAENPELEYATEDYYRQKDMKEPAYQKNFHQYLDECRAGNVDAASVAGHPGVLPCVFFDQPGAYSFKRPCGLYYAMYRKIVDFAVRGMIWYQGESEAFAETASTYASAMETLLIHLKRHQAEPYEFHYVQIAPWKYDDIRQWEDICNAQRIFSLRHPECGMITIGDFGGGEDIHPPCKRPVGERLAFAALNLTYGKKKEYSGPIALSASVEEEGVCIMFLHNEGLYFKEQQGLFEGIYADGTVKAGCPEIKDDQVFLRFETTKNLKRVRYEYRSDYEIGLFNKYHLPASVFQLEV